MDEWSKIIGPYLSSLPPVLAFMGVAALFLLKHWSATKADFASEKALSAVSTGYKILVDSQQSRIAQQDIELTRLHVSKEVLQVQIDRAAKENALLQNTITVLEIKCAELQLAINRKVFSEPMQLIANK